MLMKQRRPGCNKRAFCAFSISWAAGSLFCSSQELGCSAVCLRLLWGISDSAFKCCKVPEFLALISSPLLHQPPVCGCCCCCCGGRLLPFLLSLWGRGMGAHFSLIAAGFWGVLSEPQVRCGASCTSLYFSHRKRQRMAYHLQHPKIGEGSEDEMS